MNQTAEKRKTIEAIYPLSPMQQGMLFHTLYAPHSGVYVEQKLFTLSGHLDRAAFKQAWQKVIERHPVLRTLFVWENQQQPLQVVRKQGELPWMDYDWRDLSAQEQQQRLQDLLQSDRHQGFVLNQTPLMRFTLIELPEQRYQFLWSHHHILMDGWCLPILLKEVLTFYEADNPGQRGLLTTPRPYRDYIAWLQQQDRSEAEAFWRRTLQGFRAPTPLVVDRPQHQGWEQQPNYQTQELRLSSNVTQGLQTLAREHSLTLATLIQGAWALLLSRYSGESEVVFGVTVSGRSGNLSGIQEMVGLFINTLPLRVSVPRDKSLLGWLEQLQQTQINLQEYSYIPLADIQQLSEVQAPITLFESIVVFENYPVDQSLRQSNHSLTVTDVEVFEQTNYPLTVLILAEAELLIKLSYDRSRFDADTIARMAGHLQTILDAIAANPQQQVGELPLLTDAEQQQLLVEWNQTTTDYRDTCLHQRFEQQVERTPDAIAVEFDNAVLTYQQLNEQANQLAHYLQSLGVKPEELVGLCVERSLDMAIALLAILKAGGAYVPLDPAYPRERLAFMLEDTQSKLILTKSRLRSLLPDVPHLVCLDEQRDLITQQPTTNPTSSVTPHNLLYVIYTSGSTGQPKGITLSHQALGNLIHWHLDTMEKGVGVLQFASLSFDASFHEMFAAWCSGGTLYMISENLQLDVDKLVHFLAKKTIQKVIFPVALWQQIAQVYGHQSHLFRHLTEVVTTGEQLQITQPIIELFKQLHHCYLHNHYGPSETHVVTSYTFNDSPDTWPIYPPIGQPIANTQIYILDQQWQPVPIGVPGFLCIGGANLARGYLNRPHLTAEKFVSNPFGTGKLYQTGDMARYLPDGNIEFLGRVDHQVKIRGFRIELGEVEAVLSKHPQLSQVVVTVQGNTANEKRLVAYVVAKPEQTVTAEQLRQFLLSKLPEYAIPSTFVALNALPLTPNQKVDRRALPIPDLVFSDANEYVPPRTQKEEIIANVFASVLKQPQVGIHHNFFELGGHSLLATQVVSRLRQIFQREIPLRTLFEAPTVAELDTALTASETTNGGKVLPEITAIPNPEEPLPLSWAQERLWFLQQLEGITPTYNICSALKITGPLERVALEQAMSELIERHQVLRSTFKSSNGIPRVELLPLWDFSIPLIDGRSWSKSPQSERIKDFAIQQAQQGFDLSSEPLMRVKLLQLEEQSYILLLSWHHIIFDAWSKEIFVRELIALYQSHITQEPPGLPPLPIQYTDFAYWQRQWQKAEIIEAQLNYWQHQLAGGLPQLPLGTNPPVSGTPNHQGAKETIRLSCQLTASLKQLSQSQGVTLFMTLLASFKVLLSRHTGEEDIIIGAPIAGRHHLGTENLIGFFINTLPIRSDLSGNPSFVSLLQRVRSVTLEAYQNQDIPFEKIVEHLRPERSLSRHPIFDVTLNLLNTPAAQLEVPGLTFEPLTWSETDAKFGLSALVQEIDEQLNITLVYRRELFAKQEMENFLAQYEYLLQQIIEQPDKSIHSYSLVTPQCQSQLPDPTIRLDVPEYAPVTSQIANWVALTPQQVAITHLGERVSYAQLWQRAFEIAQVLLAEGVQPGDVVALWGEASVGLIAAMVGVFLSGGVLLIIDSTLPEARMQVMVKESGAKYLLNLGDNAIPQTLTIGAAQLIDIQPKTGEPCQSPSQVMPLPQLTPEAPAYIFFTSGSTGKPKGVLGTHRGLAHFLAWQGQTFEITPQDRVAQLIRLSFDALLRDVFLPLTHGARLCLPDPERNLEPSQIFNWLDKQQITVIHTVPTVVQYWLTQKPQGIGLESLRWLLLSGEPLTQTVVQQWRESFPASGQMVNLYGTTEMTMVQCYYPVPIEPPLGVMPGGWSLPHSQALILNPANQLCGIGEIGEIVIRSGWGTLGYINEPEAQQQRFKPNPYGDDPQVVCYYTGDLGRYRADGSVQVLGRQDEQLKIRGIQVQPGEIEAVLNQHPKVAASVVTVWEASPGDKRLVAYVVARKNQPWEGSELRTFVQQQLPDYLLPSGWVALEALPMSANGKVNRRALPDPSESLGNRTAQVAPRTPTEAVMVKLFAQLLGVEAVGVEENFFDIGGHSLLATQLVSRLREAFDLELPLRTLFSSPTPAALAVIIDKMKVTADTKIDAPKITKISRERRRVQLSSQEELKLPDSLKNLNSGMNIQGNDPNQ
ncbi:AMP-binding enzyme domain protein [Coleofasciculus chthonoplastes PCC 7420]|uniref:AMP-binding enzyme domain protein n=2 Tax=Coleofasciculus TaxID=669368 RepID=B4VZL9_9CYAN|nr:non-ribosomal peptide synthetase [Coleofasciculus chthonoplastes]EDX72591.1 AMP-binding enzyme domain protein [Coleofasciculus chthonoplastes PCC 7420]